MFKKKKIQKKLIFFSETVRVKYFLDLLVNVRYPVMLVGGAGDIFIEITSKIGCFIV
jgi:hypothetical protein